MNTHYYNECDINMYQNMLQNPEDRHIYCFPKEGNYRFGSYDKDTKMLWTNLDINLPDNHSLRKNFYSLMCSSDSMWPKSYGPNFGNHICWHEFYMYEVFLSNRGLRGFDTEHSRIMPEYTYMYASRRPRDARVYVLKYLLVNDLIQHGNILFCNDLESWNSFIDTPAYHDLLKRLLPHMPVLFHNKPEERKYNNAWQTESALPGYEHCLIDIVGETHVDQILFSEKTMRPLIHGKPFCIMGHPGQNQFLKKWGFELYDEIFNYCENTPENLHVGSYKTRFDQMLSGIKDLDKSPASLHDIKQKLLPKTKYNQSILIKTIFNDSLIPEEFLFPPHELNLGRWIDMITQVRKTIRHHEYFKQFI